MDGFSILETVAAVMTAWLVFKLLAELRKTIKDSNNGKTSERCDLD